MSVKLGKAKYGAGKKTYFKLKDGDSVFGIIPPLGDLADDGIWSVYYRVNYGYVNTAGKSRAFESSLVKNRKSNMIEVPDAAVERLDKLKATLEAAKAKKDKSAIETLHKLVGAPKSRYNLDSNHYLNAIDLQGNIGILKLRHKAKQALDVVIRKLRDKGLDPLDPTNGRYFVFTRTGTGNETAFAVSVYQKEEDIKDVGTVYRDVTLKLSEDVLGRLSTEAGQLNKLFKKPTAEQIQQIVEESNLQSGLSPNIDEILGYKSDSAATDSGDDDGSEAEGESTEPATTAKQSSLAAATETAEEAEEAQAAAPAPTPVKQAAPAATAKVAAPAKKATPAPQTTADKVADMSDDEFLSSLGISK